ncbi:MAG: glycosyltransferase family 4 protein, partial [Candidatus Neomarinimicrobiota bacterium]
HSSLWAGAALCDMKPGVPIIVSEHIKEFLIPDAFDDFQHKLIQYTYNNIQGLIAPSSSVMEAIQSTFKIPDSCKTQVIPNMVDTDYFVPLKDKPDNERFSFLIVAMLRPEKRIDTIIQAFIPIGNNFLARLNILGDGPEYKNLHTISEEFHLDRLVKFLKKKGRTEVLNAMQKTDVCLLFSEMETFGVTLIEALSCGIPVIGGNVGGANDIITPENGLIVPTDDPKALQQAMKYMINNIENYDRDKIRDDAVKRFDTKVVIAALEKFYKSLILK